MRALDAHEGFVLSLRADRAPPADDGDAQSQEDGDHASKVAALKSKHRRRKLLWNARPK
jgi:hypothetical protein